MPIESINGELLGISANNISSLYKLLHSLGNVNSSTVTDANTVSRNTIYYITNTTDIANLPDAHAGMLVTFGSGAADTTSTPAAQLFIEIVNTTNTTWYSAYWFRSRHGAANSKWSEWKSVGAVDDAAVTVSKLASDVESSHLHGLADAVSNSNYAQYFGDTPDFDNAPKNTVLVLSGTWVASAAHSPTSTTGLLITMSGRTGGTGTLQLCSIPYDGVTYYRLQWGSASSPRWSDWNRVLASADDLADGSIGYVKLGDSVNNRYVHNIADAVTDSNYTQHFGEEPNFDDAPRNSILVLSGAWTRAAENNPDGGSGTLLTLSGRDGTGSLQIYSGWRLGVNQLYYRMVWGPSDSPQWSEWKRLPSERKSEPYIGLSMFQKVGAIGDSYSNGATQRPDGTYIINEKTDRYVSWLQILARKNGFTGTNFTKGGLTTRTWLTDENGLTALQSADPQDAYFIMLGINDSNTDSRHVEVGDASDFSDTVTTPDTFYGNMGVIYRAVVAKNPKAVVVFCTCCRFGTRYEPYSEAIRAIASATDSLLIDFESLPLVKSDWWADTIVGTHPTAKMYVALANAIDSEFSNVAYTGNDLLNVYYG